MYMQENTFINLGKMVQRGLRCLVVGIAGDIPRVDAGSGVEGLGEDDGLRRDG